MAKVRINYDEIKRCEPQFVQYISQFEDLNIRFEDLLMQMEITWQGDSAQAYIARMREQLDIAKNTVVLIQEYRNYIMQTMYAYEEAEEKAANIVRSIL